MVKKTSKHRPLPRGIEILYEDDDLIIINKPAGLLTVKTETNKTENAYYVLCDYVRKGNYKSKKSVFVVHRLDQYTSGVVIFAKSQETKTALQDNWPQTKKTYIAAVHGILEEKTGTVISYLAENKIFKVYSTKDSEKGKLAKTAYKVIKEGKETSLVELDLLTGRKNQIRVHMADIGHPIVGDRKYGKSGDKYKRLALHSESITFTHPSSQKSMTITAKLPAYFREILK